jgi:hypothetical protein
MLPGTADRGIAMWPFGKSKAQREDEAAFMAKEWSKVAFDAYVPDGLLQKGVLSDYYVMGYVVRRINLTAVMACRANNVPESSAAMMTDWLINDFLGPDARAAVNQRLKATATESPEGKEIGRGSDAATRLINYWMGFKDIKTDPNYHKAVEVSRSLSQDPMQMPEITNIVYALESLTFGRYFRDKIGHPSLTAITDAMRPRFSPR